MTAKSAISHIDFDYGEEKSSVPLATECEKALHDLTQESVFELISDKNGPYRILLYERDKRLVFQIRNSEQVELQTLVLSLSPYRRLIQDYFLMIESYETFRAAGNATKLETVDMARRGIHNEGAEMIMDRLSDRIAMDLCTARRFFTLLCALCARERFIV